MGTNRKPDPDRPDANVDPTAPAEGDPEERKPFEFIERPRVAPDVYISRPELGRNPPESRPDNGRRRS